MMRPPGMVVSSSSPTTIGIGTASNNRSKNNNIRNIVSSSSISSMIMDPSPPPTPPSPSMRDNPHYLRYKMMIKSSPTTTTATRSNNDCDHDYDYDNNHYRYYYDDDDGDCGIIIGENKNTNNIKNNVSSFRDRSTRISSSSYGEVLVEKEKVSTAKIAGTSTSTCINEEEDNISTGTGYGSIGTTSSDFISKGTINDENTGCPDSNMFHSCITSTTTRHLTPRTGGITFSSLTPSSSTSTVLQKPTTTPTKIMRVEPVDSSTLKSQNASPSSTDSSKNTSKKIVLVGLQDPIIPTYQGDTHGTSNYEKPKHCYPNSLYTTSSMNSSPVSLTYIGNLEGQQLPTSTTSTGRNMVSSPSTTSPTIPPIRNGSSNGSKEDSETPNYEEKQATVPEEHVERQTSCAGTNVTAEERHQHPQQQQLPHCFPLSSSSSEGVMMMHKTENDTTTNSNMMQVISSTTSTSPTNSSSQRSSSLSPSKKQQQSNTSNIHNMVKECKQEDDDFVIHYSPARTTASAVLSSSPSQSSEFENQPPLLSLKNSTGSTCSEQAMPPTGSRRSTKSTAGTTDSNLNVTNTTSNRRTGGESRTPPRPRQTLTTATATVTATAKTPPPGAIPPTAASATAGADAINAGIFAAETSNTGILTSTIATTTSSTPRRAASPNRIPRIPNKDMVGGGGGVASNNSSPKIRQSSPGDNTTANAAAAIATTTIISSGTTTINNKNGSPSTTSKPSKNQPVVFVNQYQHQHHHSHHVDKDSVHSHHSISQNSSRSLSGAGGAPLTIGRSASSSPTPVSGPSLSGTLAAVAGATSPNVNNWNKWNGMSSNNNNSKRASADSQQQQLQQDHEQILFEHRLCEDSYGVAVRKINQNGKSNLRYVKCIFWDGNSNSVTGGSFRGGGGDQSSCHTDTAPGERDLLGVSTKTTVSGSIVRTLSSGFGHSSSSGKHKRHSSSTSASSPAAAAAPEKNIGNSHFEPINTSTIGQFQLFDEHHQSRSRRLLTWGKKNAVKLPLSRFVCVRKGKTTERSKRNSCPPSRILSLITDHPHHPSLDIEAPTKLDRDKFARAFSKFLNIPLIEQNGNASGGDTNNDSSVNSVRSGNNNHVSDPRGVIHRGGVNSVGGGVGRHHHHHIDTQGSASAFSAPMTKETITNITTKRAVPLPVVTMTANKTTSSAGDAFDQFDNALSSSKAGVSGSGQNNYITKKILTTKPATTDIEKLKHHAGNGHSHHHYQQEQQEQQQQPEMQISSLPPSLKDSEKSIGQPTKPKRLHHDRHEQEKTGEQTATTATRGSGNAVSRGTAEHEDDDDNNDDVTQVSSLTGAGFDQEIVEELHQALNDLRAELEESRTEAARAVKVAEQAIQSAENSNSKDWNSTVTHKAAEAAAMAQKRSAEAMAKQRLAEERLEGERRNAAFWRKQAEAAEEEAGALQTRAAAAEVQRAAMAEDLESERRKAILMVESLKTRYMSSDKHQKGALDNALERNRALELELDCLRQDLSRRQQQQNDDLDHSSDNKQLSHYYESSSSSTTMTTTTSTINRKHKSFLKGYGLKKNKNASHHQQQYSDDDYRGNDATASKGLLSGTSTSSSSLQAKSSAMKMSNNMIMEIHEAGASASGSGGILIDGGTETEQILKIHAEANAVRTQFELLKKATVDELRALPNYAKFWSDQASQAVSATQSEILLLREKLALESATRRKLLHEVQDLRGTVRVYCRPLPLASSQQQAISNKVTVPATAAAISGSGLSSNSIVSFPSQDAILLHRERVVRTASGGYNITKKSLTLSPLSFKFDSVFHPQTKQNEIYKEIEEVCLGVLDGYNICLMSYGPTGSGKTYSILGDVRYSTSSSGAITSNERGTVSGGNSDMQVEIKDHGIHLQSVKQLFSVSEHRSDRYQDLFTMTIVEVHNERLIDMIAGTDMAESRGQVNGLDENNCSRRTSRPKQRCFSTDEGSAAQPSVSSKGHMTKLEIRTNHNGDTVVQGLISIEVRNFEDVCKIWEQCLLQRASRLADQGIDLAEYEAASHVIATLNVTTMNTTTGIGSLGKIQFVDLAGADLIPRTSQHSSTTAAAAVSSLSDNNSITAKTKSITIDGILSNAVVTNNNNPDIIATEQQLKFKNKSLSTLCEVVNSRSQFMHNVPYRNSTLTHLLRDNLEADTKVLCFVCIDQDVKNIQETLSTLKFAQKLKRLNIGKATKHALSRP